MASWSLGQLDTVENKLSCRPIIKPKSKSRPRSALAGWKAIVCVKRPSSRSLVKWVVYAPGMQLSLSSECHPIVIDP